jgi:hypothetical protein
MLLGLSSAPAGANHARPYTSMHERSIATKIVLFVTEQNLDNLMNYKPPRHHPESPTNVTLKFSGWKKCPYFLMEV